MLRNKIIVFLWLFGLFLLFYSCEYKKNLEYEKFSKKIIGENVYNVTFKQIEDSLINWRENKLENFKILNSANCKLDQTICFNTDLNKFVGALLIRCIRETCTQDYIYFMYGAKIKDTWCFFDGANIVLPREMYQKDITKPLSFEKLHEIALKEVFGGYLKKKEPIVPFWKFWVKQEYEIDESYFDNHFRGQGWGGGDWIEDSDGSNGHWNGRIYTDEEFNKMYKEKALSVWPSSNPLTSFYDVETKRWRNIHQDSFDILLKAKKINPNGTPVE